VEKRVVVMIHALAGVVANLPAVDVPSIFEDVGVERGDDAGWTLKEPKPHPESTGMPERMRDALIARLETLRVADPLTVNEVRRQARAKDLTFLDSDACLDLHALSEYDLILRRWEHHVATRKAAG
jgi:hypothetical protein